jgi:hypothetical protein
MLQYGVTYKVDGYVGKWSVIDDYQGYVLLEHELFGDETWYLVVKRDAITTNKRYKIDDKGNTIIYPVIVEDVITTFDDLITTLEDNDLL